jgi:hypothetical protein
MTRLLTSAGRCLAAAAALALAALRCAVTGWR